VRSGLLRSGAALAGAGRRLAPLLDPAGGDGGAMVVELTGRDAAGRRIARRWTLLAGSGHGPSIPALPAVLVARRLLDGTIGPGARACLGLFAPEDFLAEAADLDIAATTTEGAG